MSVSKSDRTVAPVTNSRQSRAKHRNKDRNTTPPAAKPTAARKPPKGHRVMEAQLAKRPPEPETRVIDVTPDDQPEVRDPWWTPERDEAFKLVLQGIPQHQVATELGRERHTIARWTEDERFVERLFAENESRFKSMRQRRAMQTVRLTDKAEQLATKMMGKAMELAETGRDDLGTRLAARDWLQEFREQSRREDEIYGLDAQNVNVNVRGSVQHNHKGKVDLSFREFLAGSLKRMGVDPANEDIDSDRANEALGAIVEKALTEGSFLHDLVEAEKQELLPALPAPTR